MKAETISGGGFCKDCKQYDDLNKKCKKMDFYVRRKNTCEDFVDK